MATHDNTIDTVMLTYSRREIEFLADRLYARSINCLRVDTPASHRDYLVASRLLRRLLHMYEKASQRTLHTVMLQEDK